MQTKQNYSFIAFVLSVFIYGTLIFTGYFLLKNEILKITQNTQTPSFKISLSKFSPNKNTKKEQKEDKKIQTFKNQTPKILQKIPPKNPKPKNNPQKSMQKIAQKSTQNPKTSFKNDTSLNTKPYNPNTISIEDSYTKLIKNIIIKHHIYPNRLKNRGIKGEVELRFSIDKKGRLNQERIYKKSSYKILDDYALKTLIKASKSFPKPKQTYHLAITLAFK